MFASSVTTTIPLEPIGKPGEFATIRKLPGRHLQKAQDTKQFAAVDRVKIIGGAAIIKDLQSLGGEEEVKKKAAQDPLSAYDPYVLIEKGLVSWTLPEKMDTASIEDLDEESVEYLGNAILKLTKPALYKNIEEQRDDEKNV